MDGSRAVEAEGASAGGASRAGRRPGEAELAAKVAGLVAGRLVVAGSATSACQRLAVAAVARRRRPGPDLLLGRAGHRRDRARLGIGAMLILRRRGRQLGRPMLLTAKSG